MTESFGGMRRTHTCGVLRAGHAGQTVTLMGWASRRRDHGGLIFVDLRDREGLTQLVFNPAQDPAAHEMAGRIRVEFVLAVEGTVERRPPGTVNAEPRHRGDRGLGPTASHPERVEAAARFRWTSRRRRSSRSGSSIATSISAGR